MLLAGQLEGHLALEMSHINITKLKSIILQVLPKLG